MKGSSEMRSKLLYLFPFHFHPTLIKYQMIDFFICTGKKFYLCVHHFEKEEVFFLSVQDILPLSRSLCHQ